MKYIFCVVICALFCAVPASADTDSNRRNIYDFMGRYAGTMEMPLTASEKTVVFFFGDKTLELNGSNYTPAAGIYFTGKQGKIKNQIPSILDDFGFSDVTELFLPTALWDAAANDIGDINGDGLEDIVFIRFSSAFLGTDDYRPRVLIQSSDGTFMDESESRIPESQASSMDIHLFDIDNDGDLDLFTGGFSGDVEISAKLYINDGNGYFTDESQQRLPVLQGYTFVYFSDFADFNNDDLLDLAVVIMHLTEPDTHEVLSSEIWINNGGYFVPDSSGRLPENPGYGFLMPMTIDVDSDGNSDIVFADISYNVTNENGQIIREFTGVNACYINTDDGYFSDQTESRMPEPDCIDTRDIAFADIDQDGDYDIAEIGLHFDTFIHQNRMIINDGTGHFTAAYDYFPLGLEGWFNDVEFGTLNDDEFPDLFLVRVSPGYLDYDVLLVNTGEGTMGDSSSLLPPILDFSTSTSLFDHQHDGDLDIFCTNSGTGMGPDTAGQNTLYHNLLEDATGIEERVPESAEICRISGYPNPFNAQTTISYSLQEQGEVVISIYNLVGQQVATLLEGTKEAGEHTVVWDASEFPTGVYFVRLESAGSVNNKKMVLLK